NTGMILWKSSDFCLPPEKAGDDVVLFKKEGLSLTGEFRLVDSASGHETYTGALAGVDFLYENLSRKNGMIFTINSYEIKAFQENNGMLIWKILHRHLSDICDPGNGDFSEFHYSFTDSFLITECLDSVFVFIDIKTGIPASYFHGLNIYSHDSYANRLYAAKKSGTGLIAFEGTEKIWSVPLPKNYTIKDLRASEKWILVQSHTGSGEKMVYRLDVFNADGKLVNTILPVDQFGYLGFIGISKDYMVYFRSSDQYMILRKLPDGAEKKLMKFTSRLVISTEAIGALSAQPGDDPLFSSPYIIIPGYEDFHVFRINE
ncbi:MAG: hypothetical protein OEZ34_12205, partial [Spirochaetia bacterium]|nr:hypothetical protein [Spirochaetia bacterium]